MAKKGGGERELAVKRKMQCGLLFELEYVAVKGRKLIFDALKKVLAARDAELTPALFSRFCLHAPPKHYLPELLESLGKTRFSPEKVLAELQTAINAAFAGKNLPLDNGLLRIAKNAADHNLLLGALTGLEPATADAVLENTELKAYGVKLVCAPAFNCVFPTAEGWLKLVRDLSLSPWQCVALVSSADASQAAIMTDVWCLALPDEYTTFQDFSGADLVVEKLDERVLREMLAIMKAPST